MTELAQHHAYYLLNLVYVLTLIQYEKKISQNWLEDMDLIVVFVCPKALFCTVLVLLKAFLCPYLTLITMLSYDFKVAVGSYIACL